MEIGKRSLLRSELVGSESRKFRLACTVMGRGHSDYLLIR